MQLQQNIAVLIYFCIVFAIGFLSHKKNFTASDFIIGGRSLNFWLTALAAHASDMSNWLFMGYPASIFLGGVFNSWTAIGLIFCMLLNWKLVATKIRTETEKYNSVTFSSFFESRLADTSGLIRVFTAIICFVFYAVYISAGLMGIGLLFENLFHLTYFSGILIGISIIVTYVLIGGYRTLAWIDLFQGLFLMCVITIVPFIILHQLGGWGNLTSIMAEKNLSLSLIPPQTSGWIGVVSLAAGWGLGYFGQPHIITKFMGIRNPSHIPKSMWVGMSWMSISLTAATLVGLVGILNFPHGIKDAEQIFIKMVESSFSPFLIGFLLCAVVAATINATSSQVLVLSSTVTEDFYKKLLRKDASSKELLFVSRLAVILVAILAFCIAYGKDNTIYSIVLYAWSGLGASFGPLLLFCLYSKNINKYGAWAGIMVGALTSAFWPLFDKELPFSISSLIPGFALSSLSILIFSYLTKNPNPAEIE